METSWQGPTGAPQRDASVSRRPGDPKLPNLGWVLGYVFPPEVSPDPDHGAAGEPEKGCFHSLGDLSKYQEHLCKTDRAFTPSWHPLIPYFHLSERSLFPLLKLIIPRCVPIISVTFFLIYAHLLPIPRPSFALSSSPHYAPRVSKHSVVSL